MKKRGVLTGTSYLPNGLLELNDSLGLVQLDPIASLQDDTGEERAGRILDCLEGHASECPSSPAS